MNPVTTPAPILPTAPAATSVDLSYRWVGELKQWAAKQCTAFHKSLKHLTATGDGEMARNRVVISLLILSYFLYEWGVNGRYLATPVITISLFFAFSVAVALHVMKSPEPNYMRRLISSFTDIGTLSFGLYIGEEVTACTWPVYLWVIYGNGFRFGQHFLLISTVTATVGFAIVMFITPFWSQFHNLSIGLLLGLVVLPVYARKLINDLSIARQRAEDANKAKSHFLASVSHELRTPLNAIIGLSECMTTTRLNSEQRNMLSTIYSSGRTLSQLIENLLDFSRLESGAMPCNKKQVKITSFMGDVCGLAGAQCKKPEVSFNLHLKNKIPTHIKTDELKLKQILTNFISNAIKFTEAGYVTLIVSSVDGEDGKPALRFEVKDTGTGISEDAQERIFERFTQENETIVDRFGGTGLGLAIVKQTAQLLGGRVGVESTPGLGSTFWCEIPAAKARYNTKTDDISDANVMLFASEYTEARVSKVDSTPSYPQGLKNLANYDALLAACEAGRDKGHDNVIITDPTTHAIVADWLADRGDHLAHLICLTDQDQQDSASESLLHTSVAQIPIQTSKDQLGNTLAWLSRLRDHKRANYGSIKTDVTPASVLIAEDNPANQLVIRKIMSNAGHEFTIVDDGEAVLSALSKQKFDVILLDLNMPVMNGFETIKFIRFALHDSKVPVIAVTADATPETAERCMESGFDNIVTKPYDAKSLVKVIDQHVSPKAEPQTASANVDEVDEGRDQVDHVDDIETRNMSCDDAGILDLEQVDQVLQLGGKAFFEQVVNAYFSECHKKLSELQACSDQNQKSQIRDLAHGLKSSALNVGASQVAEICNDIEDRATSSEISWIKGRVSDLYRASEECCDALTLYLEHTTPETDAKVAVNFH